MYNDTIKVANKIISYEDLFEIFSKMQEKLLHYQKINDIEEKKNRMLEYNYQNWTFKDNGSRLTFDVNFTDDTSVSFDNYNNFISIFNNRLNEIKYIYVHYAINYTVDLEGQKSEWYNQHINMTIYEDRMDIDVSLSSKDDKINDIYELIKSKILNAPPKYDKVIQKKGTISTMVGLAIGFIPSLIILTLLLFVPTIRQIYAMGYVVFPIASLVLAFIIGGTIGSSVLDKWYSSINPEQKYAGYDTTNYKSIYKDDIDGYVKSSEILIGKNVNNLTCRKNIISCYEKYKKYIPYEIGVMILLSIIVLFLGGI